MNENKFRIERNGHVFRLIACEEVDEYGQLKIRYRVDNGKECNARDYKDGVIYLYAENIDGKKVDGIKIGNSEIEQKIEKMKRGALKKREAEKERARNFIPHTIRWAVGGDTLDVYVVTDEVDADETPVFCKEIKSYLNSLNADGMKEIKKLSKKLYGLKTGLYSQNCDIIDENDESKNWYGWWQLDVEKIRKAVGDRIAEKEKKKQKAEREKQEIEGAIAFNRCWECGRCRITGKIENGSVKRMAHDEWKRADEAFKRSWGRMFKAIDKEKVLSSAGTDWREHFKNEGYKSAIISEEYCGC